MVKVGSTPTTPTNFYAAEHEEVECPHFNVVPYGIAGSSPVSRTNFKEI